MQRSKKSSPFYTTKWCNLCDSMFVLCTERKLSKQGKAGERKEHDESLFFLRHSGSGKMQKQLFSQANIGGKASALVSETREKERGINGRKLFLRRVFLAGKNVFSFIVIVAIF